MIDRYAGIYLERGKVYTSICRAKPSNDDGSPPELIPEILIEAKLNTKIPTATIAKSVAYIIDFSKNIRGIGIASYGPFLSLNPRDISRAKETKSPNIYGKIWQEAEAPLKGLDLYTTVCEAWEYIAPKLPTPPILIHTDAMAGAIAEANWGSNAATDVLAYVFLTEGTGGAFVTGRYPLNLSTYSEMGNVHVEPFKPDEKMFLIGKAPERSDYGKGDIGLLARSNTIARRLGLPRNASLQKIRDKMFSDSEAEETLNNISHYFAQLCMAATAILMPKKIVVGGFFGAQEAFVEKVQNHFRVLYGGRGSILFPPEEMIDKFIVRAGFETVDCITVGEDTLQRKRQERAYLGPCFLGWFAQSNPN